MRKLSILVTLLVCATPLPITPAWADDPQQSLLAIYELALAHDAKLASALSANKAAQEILEQSKALYRPVINFNAGVNASRTEISFNSIASPFRGGVQTFEAYNYGVEARQPIYRKQNLVQMDQAKTQVSQADKQFYLSLQDLIVRTTEAYFDVLIAQDNMELIDAQKTAILSQLTQAKANFAAGTTAITDVNEAQARYDLIAAQQIAAINDHQIAQRALQAITGAMPDKLATVKATIKPLALKQDIAQWLKIAEQNNLNLQIHQDAVNYSAQEIERAQAGHWPTLDAVASYDDTSSNGGQFGFGNDLSSSAIGLQLQIPLYQGGATNSRVRQAILNKQKAQDDAELARRQTELETQRAYLNLNTSIAEISAYQQALVSSQTQLESTDQGYRVGIRTSIDVLNAQQQLFAAKRDLLAARYGYLVNIIRLKAAAGVVAEADLIAISQQMRQ